MDATASAAVDEEMIKGSVRLHRNLVRINQNLPALIQAHDLARTLLGADNSLDITLCWMLARDLRLGSAYLRPCPRCQIHSLVTEQGRFDLGCPLYARYRSLGLSSLKLALLGSSFCDDEPSRVRAPQAHPSRETGLAGCGERTR